MCDYNLLPCGVFATDPMFRIVYCNKKFTSYLKLTIEDTVERRVDELLTKASKILFQQIVVPSTLNQDIIDEVQLNFIDSNNTKFPMVVFSHQTKNSNAQLIWCCFPAKERNILLNKLSNTKKQLEDSNFQLKMLSKTDPLTGCNNRREMFFRLGLIRRQVERKKTCFGILLLDLDHFKIINDNHGHAEGDHVLKQFAQLLIDNARFDDIVARYGGEEFIILLPEINLEGLETTAKRIHSNMNKIKTKSTNITVSIGAHLVSHGTKETDEELIDLADSALYKSKNSGRNKTTLYSIPTTKSGFHH